jgi:hypothetical protein
MNARTKTPTKQAINRLQGDADAIWADGHRSSVLAHLNEAFPTGTLNSKIEDGFQDLLLRIWNPGIQIIGERSLWCLKFHARREMIRIAREDRRKRSYPSGGISRVDFVDEREISIDNQLALQSEVILFCEEFGVPLQRALNGLDMKQRAIAGSLIKEAAFEPSARQVFEGMSPAEQLLFADSRKIPKAGPSKEKAIRAVSRRVREVQTYLAAHCGALS